MRRRDFIKGIAGSAVAWPLAAHAQQPEQKRLIGVLMPYAESDSAVQSWLAAFRAALAKLGWSEGSNLRIELRWAPLIRIRSERSQKSWSICGPTRSSV
jgi:putative ABC transport system substrate-binding protein